MKDNSFHKFYLSLTFCLGLWLCSDGQEFSAANLIKLLSVTAAKTEAQLKTKGYVFAGFDVAGDTSFKTFQYRYSRKTNNSKPDSNDRKFIIATLKETYTLAYLTNSAIEYRNILGGLKLQGFYCEYEKDSSASKRDYLFQHGEYTADACIKNVDGSTWYSVTFFKKIVPARFNSHEYLVHYFGKENVKKDLYYFSQNDIANCSVLFIRTNRQVIFVWRDEVNRRTISNLLFGGKQNLKSQQTNVDVISENVWRMKNGIRVGMHLVELQTMNEKEIALIGGRSPNPGLILPECSGKIDFNNVDVVLGCNNCTDDQYLMSKKMMGNEALQQGRILFVQTFVLYPPPTGTFE